MGKVTDEGTNTWKLKNLHREMYYFRLKIITIETAENDTVDVNTWKLCILQCLQQLKGVLGQSIEFDIMTSEEIKGTETIVRVHYNDRVVFSQCVAAGTFTSHNGTGDASIQIVAQSAFLQGIMVPNSV